MAMDLRSAAMKGELEVVRRILDRISVDHLDLMSIQVISWVTYQGLGWKGLREQSRKSLMCLGHFDRNFPCGSLFDISEEFDVFSFVLLQGIQSALWAASSKGHTDIVELFLEFGVPCVRKNVLHRTMIWIA